MGPTQIMPAPNANLTREVSASAYPSDGQGVSVSASPVSPNGSAAPGFSRNQGARSFDLPLRLLKLGRLVTLFFTLAGQNWTQSAYAGIAKW